MKNFNKSGSFGDRGGRSNFGRPSFGRPSFNNRGRNDKFGPPEMHEAICANCGKKCEVPFRPNNKKPVYCKECFGEHGGSAGGDKFPKRDFGARPTSRPNFENRNNGNNDQVTKQLEAVNTKLERLIDVIQKLASNEQLRSETNVKIDSETRSEPTKVPKKTLKKKK